MRGAAATRPAGIESNADNAGSGLGPVLGYRCSDYAQSTNHLSLLTTLPALSRTGFPTDSGYYRLLAPLKTLPGKMMFSRFPFDRVNWLVSSFLIGTLFLSLTAVPLYLYFFGIDWFQIVLFFFMLYACGFSITLGYHRLFSHLAFRANWLVRLFTVIFGAGAFEGSVLWWAAEHRSHHKHVDHDEDPYSISKGLFHAHIGWLMFKLKPETSLDNVADLNKDSLLAWQHRNVNLLSFLIAFVFPATIGFLWGGWKAALGAFLIAGVLRVVVLQHSTFCINSLCHYFGSQPYSSKCSARDSWLMAIVTLGEGYHNYHHEFQHDYRNGVKPWQIDPTKWIIWTLSKFGLVKQLRRVPTEKIVLCELAEAQRQLEKRLANPSLSATAAAYLTNSYQRLQSIAHEWAEHRAKQIEVTREMLADLRREIRAALSVLRLPDFAPSS
jgi:stearoyl-CoA desaturase (Delta-9 desaturase)